MKANKENINSQNKNRKSGIALSFLLICFNVNIVKLLMTALVLFNYEWLWVIVPGTFLSKLVIKQTVYETGRYQYYIQG